MFFFSYLFAVSPVNSISQHFRIQNEYLNLFITKELQASLSDQVKSGLIHIFYFLWFFFSLSFYRIYIPIFLKWL